MKIAKATQLRWISQMIKNIDSGYYSFSCLAAQACGEDARDWYTDLLIKHGGKRTLRRPEHFAMNHLSSLSYYETARDNRLTFLCFLREMIRTNDA